MHNNALHPRFSMGMAILDFWQPSYGQDANLPKVNRNYFIFLLRHLNCFFKEYLPLLFLPKILFGRISLWSLLYCEAKLFYSIWLATAVKNLTINWIIVSNGIFKIWTIYLAILGNPFVKEYLTLWSEIHGEIEEYNFTSSCDLKVISRS